ncbi:DNA-binding protein [Sorangium cellulosum]|uniref:DNA-binding protein n=1 Tax=Sorangium cellulosum TaxID=56 RepID=A0A2L0F637_SORCE|nr:TIGR00725 family protein [Sorangium cellulosum]AUX46987.1 DNA-binding protein [Sorangium cellulosum]
MNDDREDEDTRRDIAPYVPRRPVLAVIGNGLALDDATEAACVELGRRAVEVGFRLVTGGLGGVMTAVSRGGREARTWRDGDILGILPGYEASAANPYVDIVVPTGMQIGRNILVVAAADVVVIVDGGAGTLSEIAIAWQLGKPLLALATSGGWAQQLAGARVDERRPDEIVAVASAEQAVDKAWKIAGRGRARGA